MKNRNELLSYLWIFVLLNYLYCDIVGLMDAQLLQQYLKGNVNNITISDSFLLSASILMEIPLAMILISKFTPFSWNKKLNIASSILMTVVQVSTLFMATPTTYYMFFSVIEITCTLFILFISIKWKNI